MQGEVWHLYVLRCADGRLYTGVSTDPQRRFGEHSAGGSRAAKSLRGKGPFELEFTLEIGTRGDALRAEYRFKQLARRDKELFILQLRDQGESGESRSILLAD